MQELSICFLQSETGFSVRSKNVIYCIFLHGMIRLTCYCSHTGNRKGVECLSSIYSFIVSIMQNVAAYYICKWLDGDE